MTPRADRPTNPTPEVGQVWADNDERTVNPEFTITHVDRFVEFGAPRYVVAQRKPSGLKVRILAARLANTGSRGYRYIGRSK